MITEIAIATGKSLKLVVVARSEYERQYSAVRLFS